MKTAPEDTWLQPGQPYMVWMPRGTHLLVQCSSVTLVAPSGGWFDPGQVIQTTVPAGCAHHLRHGGWVRLEATGSRPAQVRCIAPGGDGHRATSPMPGWVTAQLARWR